MAEENKNRTEYRPWGYFTVLDEGAGYKVKKIAVNPGHRLSLQLHRHRSEEWVVVEGKPTLRCGQENIEYSAGERISISKGKLHRIENKTSEVVSIIEVQIGEYLGEDDIVRFEDDYSRLE